MRKDKKNSSVTSSDLAGDRGGGGWRDLAPVQTLTLTVFLLPVLLQHTQIMICWEISHIGSINLGIIFIRENCWALQSGIFIVEKYCICLLLNTNQVSNIKIPCIGRSSQLRVYIDTVVFFSCPLRRWYTPIFIKPNVYTGSLITCVLLTLYAHKCHSKNILTLQLYLLCFPHVTIMTVYWAQSAECCSQCSDVQGGTVG